MNVYNVGFTTYIFDDITETSELNYKIRYDFQKYREFKNCNKVARILLNCVSFQMCERFLLRRF